MSYPTDLDEMPETTLLAELERRATLRSRGLCDYCGTGPDTAPCKFPGRHSLLGLLSTVTTGRDLKGLTREHWERYQRLMSRLGSRDQSWAGGPTWSTTTVYEVPDPEPVKRRRKKSPVPTRRPSAGKKRER